MQLVNAWDMGFYISMPHVVSIDCIALTQKFYVKSYAERSSGTATLADGYIRFLLMVFLSVQFSIAEITCGFTFPTCFSPCGTAPYIH